MPRDRAFYNTLTTIALSSVLLPALFLSGCTLLSLPERPVYQGTDSVSIASPDQIIGTWKVVELNPLPNTPAQSTTIEYLANGEVTGYVETLDNDSELPAGFTMKLRGEWSLVGDVVTHNNMTMSSTDNSPFSQLLTDAFNSQPKIESQANIMEIDTNRFVMIGQDGAAMEYTRQ